MLLDGSPHGVLFCLYVQPLLKQEGQIGHRKIRPRYMWQHRQLSVAAGRVSRLCRAMVRNQGSGAPGTSKSFSRFFS